MNISQKNKPKDDVFLQKQQEIKKLTETLNKNLDQHIEVGTKLWDKLHEENKNTKNQIQDLYHSLILDKYLRVSILTTSDIQTINHNAETSKSTGVLESHIEAGNVIYLVSTRSVIFPYGVDKWWHDKLMNSDLPHKLFFANAKDYRDFEKGWRDLYTYLKLKWPTEEDFLIDGNNDKPYYEENKHDREFMEAPANLYGAQTVLKKTGNYDWGNTEMVASS